MIYLFTGDRVKDRRREIISIIIRLSLYVAAIYIFLPVGIASAFLGVQLAVFGVYMGASFAPNHKGMPMIPKESRIDFFSRQVLTSRNVMARTTFGNRVLSHVFGGLNYQVEHHLFPSMPRANLAGVAAIVREYCHELKVPYTVTSVTQSYAQVITYLNKVGLSARDPFDCPMVGEFRPLQVGSRIATGRSARCTRTVHLHLAPGAAHAAPGARCVNGAMLRPGN